MQLYRKWRIPTGSRNHSLYNSVTTNQNNSVLGFGIVSQPAVFDNKRRVKIWNWISKWTKFFPMIGNVLVPGRNWMIECWNYVLLLSFFCWILVVRFWILLDELCAGTVGNVRVEGYINYFAFTFQWKFILYFCYNWHMMTLLQ